jgi:hypothetical protein
MLTTRPSVHREARVWPAWTRHEGPQRAPRGPRRRCARSGSSGRARRPVALTTRPASTWPASGPPGCARRPVALITRPASTAARAQLAWTLTTRPSAYRRPRVAVSNVSGLDARHEAQRSPRGPRPTCPAWTFATRPQRSPRAARRCCSRAARSFCGPLDLRESSARNAHVL